MLHSAGRLDFLDRLGGLVLARLAGSVGHRDPRRSIVRRPEVPEGVLEKPLTGGSIQTARHQVLRCARDRADLGVETCVTGERRSLAAQYARRPRPHVDQGRPDERSPVGLLEALLDLGGVETRHGGGQG